jgi:hypothetical protein
MPLPILLIIIIMRAGAPEDPQSLSTPAQTPWPLSVTARKTRWCRRGARRSSRRTSPSPSPSTPTPASVGPLAFPPTGRRGRILSVAANGAHQVTWFCIHSAYKGCASIVAKDNADLSANWWQRPGRAWLGRSTSTWGRVSWVSGAGVTTVGGAFSAVTPRVTTDYDYRGPVGVVLFNHASEDFPGEPPRRTPDQPRMQGQC